MTNGQLMDILKDYPNDYNIEINIKGNGYVTEGMGKDIWKISQSDDAEYPDWLYLIVNMRED